MGLKHVVALVFISTTLTGVARGGENPSRGGPPSGAAYDLDAGIEVPLFVMSGMLTVTTVFATDMGQSSCAVLCEPRGVNGMDRWLAGRYDEDWKLASDISLAGSIGLGVSVLFIDGGFLAGLWDGVVVAEAALMNIALTMTLKIAVGRSRPYMYGEDAPLNIREDRDGGQSFPSGHTSMAAVLTTSVFSVLIARRPDSPWPWVYLAAGSAVTGLVGASRVLAGKHFLTDVLAGAALGAAVGLVVPALHRQRRVEILPAVGSGGGGLALTGSF